MRRTSLAVLLGLLVAFESGCFPAAEHPAKIRAANEFDCPYDDVDLTERRDLSAQTVDVNACGHVARYTCVRGICTREPME